MRVFASVLILVVLFLYLSTASRPAERLPVSAEPSQPLERDALRPASWAAEPAALELAAAVPEKAAAPTAPAAKSPAPARLEFVRGPSVVRVPPGGHPPVLSDCISRLPNPAYWRDQTEPTDLVTWTHEGSHGVSVRLPRVQGSHAVYLLNGLSVYLRHPNVTIGQVAATIPAKDRGRIFNLYMVEQRRDWDREPIYLVEEWVCYVHGTFARRQLGLVQRQETERHAAEMERYCRAMLALAARLDPDYPDAAKLAAFIEWNAARFWAAVE